MDIDSAVEYLAEHGWADSTQEAIDTLMLELNAREKESEGLQSYIEQLPLGPGLVQRRAWEFYLHNMIAMPRPKLCKGEAYEDRCRKRLKVAFEHALLFAEFAIEHAEANAQNEEFRRTEGK